jgi:hypothetical protein
MRSGLGQAQELAVVRPTPETMIPVAVAPTTKEISYDYVATFILKGQCGNRVQDVINISVEGAFVAVAIGYSFIPGTMRGRCQAPPPAPPPDTSSAVAQATTLATLFAEIRRSVDLPMAIECLLVRLCGIDFKYSIIDSGTGRELQNKPIHNIAGLGEATGDRPFRPLAKPMLFMPRSTIRIEVEEISVGGLYTNAELFIVLHGYKMLGYGTALL